MRTRCIKRNYLTGAVFFFAVAGITSCQFAGSPTTSEAKLGKFHIIVSPACDNPSSHIETNRHPDGSEELLSAQYLCGVTSILVQHGTLIVNGQTYGAVKDDDSISVRNGQVLVNSKARSAGQD